MTTALREQFMNDVATLNEAVWERRVPGPLVDKWLDNFTGAHAQADAEQLHALYLLSRFLYLGDKEVRELLRCLFRDLYQYPILRSIRERNANTLDLGLIEREFKNELDRTRFFGVGNPSESGSHLLYYFRQENSLSRRLFLNPHEIFKPDRSSGPQLRHEDVKHYVFIDDFAGSGTQAKQYSHDIVEGLLDAAAALGKSITCSYFPLVARKTALDAIRQATRFHRVEAILEMDETFRVFEPSSRYFRACPSEITRDVARAVFVGYGNQLDNKQPLGYKNGQLLLGFHHNTPDNTILAFWYHDDSSSWQPAFHRYPKQY